jgi:alpha-L-glutamate ligase-like protein
MDLFPRWLPWRRFRELGLLGMNQRNADFILNHNPRENFPRVDDKRRTKALALAAGIAVPELYAVIEIEHQINELPHRLAPYKEFVVKPAHGSGGAGILVITGRANGCYRKASGILLTEEEFAYHISNMLSGLYSLGGLPDTALVEYRVDVDPLFENVSYQGVPDIRTIVFRGVPILAMLRLPTRMSDGRANLHQGAIGVGVDLIDGCSLSGIWRDGSIERHPDTGGWLAGLKMPHWDEILTLTARCQELAGLGYIGVDIVLDRRLGPLVLEINARPGLNIQLANKAGLLPRLKRIERLRDIPASAAERVEIAKAIARL